MPVYLIICNGYCPEGHMLTVRLLHAGAQEADDASGAAAIMWLQGDRQGAVQTLLQSLARRDNTTADGTSAEVLLH